jgi:hypothetical protein
MPVLEKRILLTVGWALLLATPLLAQDTGVYASDESTSILSQDITEKSGPDTTAKSELPDSPGSAWLKSQSAAPQADNTPSSSSASQQQSNSAPNAQPQEQKAEQPVGTAAAEGPAVRGITAAQPAGVAIAPGKQRRVRTIVIRVGAIVGGAAALGAVIALTAGTSSKPPGAH